MFKLFVSLLLLAIISDGVAQVKNPVKWIFTAKKLKTGTYEVHLTAIPEKGWHIYSQATPEGGPIPTTFTFTENALLTLSEKVKEVGKMEVHFEKLFDVEVKQYANKVDFVQIAKTNAKTNLSGSVEYMLCNDKECLPPVTTAFSIALN